MVNLVSFAILCFLFWGRSLRFKNLRLHIWIMCGVIVADLALVTALVIWRDALGKIHPGMPWTLMVHIPIAVTTLLFYFPTAWTGYQLSRGLPVRARMRRLDRVVVVGRTLTFLTSVMVQFLKP